VESWLDGSKYTGEYLKGEKCGNGRYEWPDNSFYDGQWENNMISGSGYY
jgi:hypothetical protein